MQQTRPPVQDPLARPPYRLHAMLSAQIPVSLLGDVQLVNGTNQGVTFVFTAVHNLIV